MPALFATALLAAALAAQPSTQPATAPAGNAELREMYEADQAARSGPDLDWAAVSAADAKRRARLDEIREAGDIVTADDHFHAAMLLQHGDSPEDYNDAHELAKRAFELDPDLRVAGWLSAAAKDRYLLAIGEPQWYGTQYSGSNGLTILREVDETKVTDEQRKALGVPTLADARGRLTQMNANRSLSADDNPELEEAFVAFITEMFAPARKPGQAWDVPEAAQVHVETVNRLIEAEAVNTPADLAKAAAILHYAAETADDYRRQLALLERARAAEPDSVEIARDYARTYDRLRVKEGKGQWYGTSITTPQASASGQWEFNLDPDSTVTDAEREAMGLMPASFWREEVERRNAELDADAGK